MAKNRIYEINDVFSVFGYALVVGMPLASSVFGLTVEVIPVDSFMDVVKGLLSTETGNLVALGIGAGALLIEKYIRYKRIA
jgi:hypothetical protein